MLISGGEVTVPKLFVNNNTGKISLVGFWDVVAFDEFAGKQKKLIKLLLTYLKITLLIKHFLGVETLGAESSMAFIGNTKHNVPFMLKYSDFFEELPDKYYDPAFIDRLHAFLPGWEVDIIRGEMFSSGFGFVVDYIAEILRDLRNKDYSDRYKPDFSLSDEIATRDRDAVNKTFSGLMKVIFPDGEQTIEETEEILKFSIECRKRVKDQLMRFDSTFKKVDFSYKKNDGVQINVQTLEETEYPEFYYNRSASDEQTASQTDLNESQNPELLQPEHSPINVDNNLELKEGHEVIKENQKGISFLSLFGDYLKGSKQIIITDSYLRTFHQIRNLMEFIEVIVTVKSAEEEVEINVITSKDDIRPEQQEQYLENIQNSIAGHGININWQYEMPTKIHARHIVIDQKWKITLDRGLDIFQRYEMNDSFSLGNRIQKARACKAF